MMLEDVVELEVKELEPETELEPYEEEEDEDEVEDEEDDEDDEDEEDDEDDEDDDCEAGRRTGAELILALQSGQLSRITSH